MAAEPHDAMETALGYCDTLQGLFDKLANCRLQSQQAAMRKEFAYWLELQRNWLLSGLSRSFAYGDNDGTERITEADVNDLLRASNERHNATAKKGR